MVDGLNYMEKIEGRCTTCSLGRQCKEVIDMGVGKALELVHLTICGPTRTPLLSGARYFLLLVDDLS